MKGVTMDLKELHELKERLFNAQYELAKVEEEVKKLPPAEKYIFDDIVIW